MSGPKDEKEQQERAKRAMADPEIQKLLREPEVVNFLNDLKIQPKEASQQLMKDKKLSEKINKLIEAGILNVG